MADFVLKKHCKLLSFFTIISGRSTIPDGTDRHPMVSVSD